MPSVKAGIAILCFATAVSLSAQAHAAACNPAALRALAPQGVQIVKAKQIKADDGVGAYCLVEGTMPTHDNQLRFRLGLPEDWNGKFLFEGMGAAVGILVKMEDGVRRGYATATTDTGHDAFPNDFSWALNAPEKKIDWGHRAVHVATVGTKALVQAFYSQPIRYAYIRGCSNGGRQGLIEAQRYPDDYDGVLSGAPPIYMHMLLGWLWNAQAVRASAESELSPKDWALVGRTVRAACDAKDGLQDGLIEDSRRCEMPRQLLCQGSKTADCLSAPQMQALDKIWNKPRFNDGSQLYSEGRGYEDVSSVWSAYASAPRSALLGALNPQPIHMESWASGATLPLPGLLSFLFDALIHGVPAGHEDGGLALLRYVLLDDPNVELASFDVRRDGMAALNRWPRMLDADDANLSPFIRRGSKLLLWHGWADSFVPPEATLQYFSAARAEVQKQGLSAAQFDESARLYMIPAMSHCAAGPGPSEVDMLGVLDRWVEKGETPQALTALQRDTEGKPLRSRPLCPAPLVARYSGQGSVDDAASFRCGAAETVP